TKMGTGKRGITSRTASSITITFQYQGQRCRESLPLKPTAVNLKKAEMFRAAILESIMRGTFDYSITFPDSKNAEKFAVYQGQVQSVERYFEKWLEAKKPHLSASTHNGYK